MQKKILVMRENTNDCKRFIKKLDSRYVVYEADNEAGVRHIIATSYKELDAIIICAEKLSDTYIKAIRFMKTNPVLALVPVIVILNEPGDTDIFACLDSGAEDCISFSSNIEIVARRIDNLIHLCQMTNIANMFRKEKEAKSKISEAQEEVHLRSNLLDDSSTAVVVIDVETYEILYIKSKVKAHNSAMKKLTKLQNDMRNIDNGSVDVYDQLLIHKNDMVKLQAAAHCIQVGILKQKSIKILKQISRDSQDSICRFDAEMILQNFSMN